MRRDRDPALMRAIHWGRPLCQVTGGRENITLDHLVSRGQGGADHEDNLMPIEHALHMEKHGGKNNRQVRMMQRHVMTEAQVAYVVATKGEGWLDTRYPVPDLAALERLEVLRAEAR